MDGGRCSGTGTEVLQFPKSLDHLLNAETAFNRSFWARKMRTWSHSHMMAVSLCMDGWGFRVRKNGWYFEVVVQPAVQR